MNRQNSMNHSTYPGKILKSFAKTIVVQLIAFILVHGLMIKTASAEPENGNSESLFSSNWFDARWIPQSF